MGERLSCLPAAQDTYLLATQQEATLAVELEAARATLKSSDRAEVPGDSAPIMDRRRLFCHRSPTDNFLIALGRWLDAAVPRVPNRYRLLVAADAAGARTPTGSPWASETCGWTKFASCLAWPDASLSVSCVMLDVHLHFGKHVRLV